MQFCEKMYFLRPPMRYTMRHTSVTDINSSISGTSDQDLRLNGTATFFRRHCPLNVRVSNVREP
jgi:hypothetical protein